MIHCLLKETCCFLKPKYCTISLELGCRGVLDRSNAANLEVLLNQLGIRSFKKVRSDLGKLALLGSYRIWLARQSEIWTPGPLLRVGGCISPASTKSIRLLPLHPRLPHHRLLPPLPVHLLPLPPHQPVLLPLLRPLTDVPFAPLPSRPEV